VLEIGHKSRDERTITVKFEVLKDSVITEAHGDANIEQAILEAELSDHAMSHVRRAAEKRAPARKAAKRAPAKKAVRRRAPAKKTARRAPARKAARRR
jgi:DNA-binding protein HU-beta